MQSIIEAIAAANLAGVSAYARAVLASATADDPAVVAVVLEVTSSSLVVELQDRERHAVGGYEL